MNVQITYRTTPALVEALEAFIVRYNREHPGANLPVTRAVDILLREALRNRGLTAADELPLEERGPRPGE